MLTERETVLLVVLGGVVAIYAATRSGTGATVLADAVDATVNAFTPRGIRNNNPGNIRYDGTAWDGLANPPSDGAYCVFTDPVYGIRAMARVISNYVDRDGVENSVAGIISRWAPPQDNNNTSAYISAVSQSLGLDPSDEIPSDALPALLAAIIQHENGQQPYTADQISQGVALS